MSSEKIIHVTKDSFDNEVIQSEIPVLVDFWAAWCGPCKLIAPVLDKIAEKYENKLKVCKVDVDQEGVISAEHMVMSIPTLIFFKDGAVVNKMVGVKNFDELSSANSKINIVENIF
jgi:thioredoxin 1